jgi:hypothetical protein
MRKIERRRQWIRGRSAKMLRTYGKITDMISQFFHKGICNHRGKK